MKTYEAIRLLKADRKEFLKKYGIKSHMSNLPSELEAELFGEEKKIQAEPKPAKTVDLPKAELVVETQSKQCPVDIETLKISLCGAGNKSPYWEWRHLLNG